MTSSLVSASAVRERLAHAATDARQVTGASQTADPASAMDMLMAATRGLEPASIAGTTLEETSATGDISDQAE